MITRLIDSNNDFTFGAGISNYLTEENAVNQNIKTRLQSFYNDCFFDTEAGIDWFNFLGYKNHSGLKNAVAKMILTTTGVSSLDELSFSLSENRQLLIQYRVTTLWSETVSNTITLE